MKLVRGLRSLLLCVAVARGSVAGAQSRTMRLPSKVLGETRVIHISTPPNYRVAKRRYPVVLLLDGQARPFFDLAVAATGYDLTGDMHDFAMPAQIVVGVEQGDRGSDLGRNDVAFTRFLREELLPYLDREYRTLPFRTLIGHSLGGRFALLTLCRAPTLFSATIAISPSVSDSISSAVQTCVRAQWTARSPRMQQLVLSAGGRESRIAPGVERLAAFFQDSLRAGWRAMQVGAAGLGHTETPFITIPAGLRFVFSTDFWEIDRASADSLVAHQGDLQRILAAAMLAVSARVGFAVEASPKWMAEVARGYLARGSLDTAVTAAQRLITGYPEELLGYGLLADAQLARRDHASARRAVIEALAMLDKLEWFDETQRERQRAHFREALASIAP